jgi:hypothetical protein
MNLCAPTTIIFRKLFIVGRKWNAGKAAGSPEKKLQEIEQHVHVFR